MLYKYVRSNLYFNYTIDQFYSKRLHLTTTLHDEWSHLDSLTPITIFDI